MNQGHSPEPSGSHRDTGQGEVYKTGEIPRFKHKAKFRPRYSPALAAVVTASFVGACMNLVRALHGAHTTLHYAGDAATDLVLFVAVCALWSAWEREQEFPQQLPRREFDRQYPPSTGSGPMPQPQPLRRTEYPDE